MQLPSEIISQFAKITKDDTPKAETTVYGTIEEKDGKKYVRLDGANTLTPISTTVDMQEGERVTVMIKNHEAVVTGNITSPAARNTVLNQLAETTSKGMEDLTQRTESDVLVDLIYPVGSIYISVSSADPKNLFGHGTWERIKDRFLLSSGDIYTAGSIGGEAAHKLTVNEIPSHNHVVQVKEVALSTGTNVVGISLDGADANEYTTGNTGGSVAHNNMPPYLAVYVWKRVA